MDEVKRFLEWLAINYKVFGEFDPDKSVDTARLLKVYYAWQSEKWNGWRPIGDEAWKTFVGSRVVYVGRWMTVAGVWGKHLSTVAEANSGSDTHYFVFDAPEPDVSTRPA
jgi:hypothetical protein